MNESPEATSGFDFVALPPQDRYRLLTNFVVPRPIALVSTVCEDGTDNAAPMSFFNVFSHDPPIVILGIQPRADGREKDTMANIRRSGAFVINMVDLAIAKQMIVCGANFEAGVDELAISGLNTLPSEKVAARRIAETPCALECKVERIIDYPKRAIILGEVLMMHVRRECLDSSGRYVRPDTYQPIARLHADNYVATSEQFILKKPPALEGENIAAGAVPACCWKLQA